VIFDFFRKIYGGLFLNPVLQIMRVTVLLSADEDERPTGNVASSSSSRKPEKRPRQLPQAPSYEASTPRSNKQ